MKTGREGLIEKILVGSLGHRPDLKPFSSITRIKKPLESFGSVLRDHYIIDGLTIQILNSQNEPSDNPE